MTDEEKKCAKAVEAGKIPATEDASTKSVGGPQLSKMVGSLHPKKDQASRRLLTTPYPYRRSCL